MSEEKREEEAAPSEENMPRRRFMGVTFSAAAAGVALSMGLKPQSAHAVGECTGENTCDDMSSNTCSYLSVQGSNSCTGTSNTCEGDQSNACHGDSSGVS